MAISRDEMKKLRLRAMGVVGEQTQATADMYQRVITAGDDVSSARKTAETAHMGALQEQIGDLHEMYEELGEFAQAVPSNGGGTGTTPPARATAAPSAGTAALAALNAAQPAPKAWGSDGSEGSKPDQVTVNGVAVPQLTINGAEKV